MRLFLIAAASAVVCALSPAAGVSRRHATGIFLGAAAATPLPRPARALNIERLVAELDREATKRTPADFSSVMEIRPISGPLGVKSALVIMDAGNAGQFDYVWIKDELSGKVIAVTSAAAPPGPLKTSASRGGFVRPYAYSKSDGLYEGDAIEVLVGEYRPEAKYDGRPDGPLTIGGKGLYAR